MDINCVLGRIDSLRDELDKESTIVLEFCRKNINGINYSTDELFNIWSCYVTNKRLFRFVSYVKDVSPLIYNVLDGTGYTTCYVVNDRCRTYTPIEVVDTAYGCSTILIPYMCKVMGENFNEDTLVDKVISEYIRHNIGNIIWDW
ncbi:MAG: hypothetical protein GY861_21660 [bacterium]|nr:hypothetical protein [bacterium]